MLPSSRRALTAGIASLLSCALPMRPSGLGCAWASEYQTAASALANDFAANEAARESNARRVNAGRAQFDAKIFAVEQSFTEREFVTASDELALYVIGQGRIPEGIPISIAVARIRAAYNILPRYSYPCESGGRTQCFTHAAQVEASYAALLRELRKYSRAGFSAQSGGSELPNSASSF